MAYQLELLEEAQIHDIFHVFCLKKAYGSNWQSVPLPMMNDAFVVIEPLVILARCMVKMGNRAAAQVLIHWKNSSPEEATLEFSLKYKGDSLHSPLKTRVLGRGKLL